MSFEKKLQKIEEISRSLENKEVPLEKMIENFERGVRLIKECRLMLEETSKKIEALGDKTTGDKADIPAKRKK
ncbi:MAG: exodeoxyribonuclease VII small subunit [Candidatus Dadabacteria bacterium]|nr:exodeoxyribonuclease VII small subunit [Candidatus Dadabacteria bacterium]